MLLLWRCLKRCWVLANGIPAHTLAKHMQTHRGAFYIHMLDHVSLWNNIMADFCFPFLFSPGLQCRSWLSHLSGPTTGSEYLVIYIHSPMVQHVVIRPPSVNNELQFFLPFDLSLFFLSQGNLCLVWALMTTQNFGSAQMSLLLMCSYWHGLERYVLQMVTHTSCKTHHNDFFPL